MKTIKNWMRVRRLRALLDTWKRQVIKHRDEREDEAAHLASVLADHVAKAVTEARARELREAVEAVLSDLWIPSPVAPESIAQNELLHEIRAVLLARADSLAPEAPSEDWEPSPEDVSMHTMLWGGPLHDDDRSCHFHSRLNAYMFMEPASPNGWAVCRREHPAPSEVQR